MKKTRRKKVVYLLGAGATMPWGGPLASCMKTHLVDCNHYKTRHKKPQTIFKYLFDRLKEINPIEAINFETILALLESLYHYSFEKRNQLYYSKGHFNPIIYSAKKWLNQIKDYKILDEFTNEDGDQIVIFKKHINTLNSEQQLPKGSEDAFYFRDLLAYALDMIADKVLEYDNQAKISKYSRINEEMIQFLKIEKENQISRIYTLNYDRLIPNILRENGIPIFDGFSDSSDRIYTACYPADEKKILTDNNSLCYYNLHGSIYWKLHTEIVELKKFFLLYPNAEQSNYGNYRHETSNPGESLFVSNIITGNNKLQRTNFPPLNAFNFAFQKDCIEADEIYVVGYSFDDKHINRILRNAYIARGKEQKRTIITKIKDDDAYNFLNHKNNAGNKMVKDVFDRNEVSESQWSENKFIITLEDLNCHIFTNGFEPYLTHE